jgi:hypothetical protein
MKTLGVGYTFRSVYIEEKTQKSLKLMVLNFQWIKKHEEDLKMDPQFTNIPPYCTKLHCMTRRIEIILRRGIKLN